MIEIIDPKQALIDRTFNEASTFIKEGQNFAIVNATGTGKSIVLQKIIDEYFRGEEVIFLSPQKHIAAIFASHRDSNEKNIKYIEYSNIDSFIKGTPPEYFNSVRLVIADEMHRSAAKTWSKHYLRLRELCSCAISIGATATKKRTDQRDQNYDMVDLYFSSNSVGNCGLLEAIETGVLPHPTYVAVMHNVIEEVYKRKNIIKKIKNENHRRESESTLNNILIDYENRNNIEEVLEKHLKHLNEKGSAKILIFTKNISHLRAVKKELDPIFARIFSSMNYNFLEFHSKIDDEGFEIFKEKTDGLNVIYSVNKFNEGIHINDLDAIIMFRNTQSEIIYHQQIGRVLSIGGNTDPVIIDLVNNFSNIRNFSIFAELEKGTETEVKKDKKFQVPKFYDYTIDAVEAFKQIDEKINSYNIVTLSDGFTGTLYAVSRKYGISLKELRERFELGHDMDRVVKSLVYLNNLTCFGKKTTLDKIAGKYGIHKKLLIHRMNKGMTIDEAVQVTLDIQAGKEK